MVVDFPAPLGPRNPCTSPVSTVRSSPSSARVRPKVLTRPDIDMASLMTSTLHSVHNFVNVKNYVDYRRAGRGGGDPVRGAVRGRVHRCRDAAHRLAHLRLPARH